MTIDKPGPWDAATLDTLEQWDPAWADACVKMSTNPWTSGVLSRKRRVNQSRAERRMHKSQSRRHAPPHSGGGRSWGNSRRAANGAQDGFAFVDSHL